MSRKHKTEVLVLGAGPVGLFAAAQLRLRDIEVTLIDKDWRGGGFSYALGLHPDSLDLFDDLNLAEDLTRQGYRVDKMVFYDGGTPARELPFTSAGGRHPWLTILPQSLIESSLEGWLKEHKTRVQWRHHVWHIDHASRPLDLQLERWGEGSGGYSVARRENVVEKNIPYQAEFVIGADGHDSTARQSLGSSFEPAGRQEVFLVFEFESDYEADHAARVVFDESTTSILWPLPGGRCRWSFQVTDPAEFPPERVKRHLSEMAHLVTPGLDEERLGWFIRERAPWFTGSLGKLVWSGPVRFERRLASPVGREGLWLVGDAAHMCQPGGLHSMNVGFREARDLVECIHAILRRNASSACLDRYAAERTAEWRLLFNSDNTLRVTERADRFVKRNAERILSCTPASGPNLRNLLGNLGLDLQEAMTPARG